MHSHCAFGSLWSLKSAVAYVQQFATHILFVAIDRHLQSSGWHVGVEVYQLSVSLTPADDDLIVMGVKYLLQTLVQILTDQRLEIYPCDVHLEVISQRLFSADTGRRCVLLVCKVSKLLQDMLIHIKVGRGECSWKVSIEFAHKSLNLFWSGTTPAIHEQLSAWGGNVIIKNANIKQ